MYIFIYILKEILPKKLKMIIFGSYIYIYIYLWCFTCLFPKISDINM